MKKRTLVLILSLWLALLSGCLPGEAAYINNPITDGTPGYSSDSPIYVFHSGELPIGVIDNWLPDDVSIVFGSDNDTELYFDSTSETFVIDGTLDSLRLDNNTVIRFKDSGGTPQNVLSMDAVDNVYFDNGAGGSFLIRTTNAVGTLTSRLSFPGGSDRISITTYNSDINIGASYIQQEAMTAPAAPGAGRYRIYGVIGGDTLTDVCAKFDDFSVDIFAQETTELDAPIFTYPSGTEVKTVMLKPHPGIVQFVALFPDGEQFVLREFNYHSDEKIAANKGAEALLPADWEVKQAKAVEK